MADLDIVVKYRSMPSRILFVLMCLLLPLWAIASPFALIQFILLVLANPASYSLLNIISTVLALSAFSAASLVALIAAENNRIHINKDGITFPLFLTSRIGRRRHRSWHELKSAGLIGAGEASAQRGIAQLLLGFSSGSFSLPLSHVSIENQQQLLMAIELWGADCNRAPELYSYQKQLQNQNLAIGAADYTQLWEDELSRRFSSTSFVPLEPGSRLQSNKIEIIRQLAFGGLSALYLAQYEGKQRIIVKEAVIPADAEAQMKEKAEAQLAREAELLSKLDHPRITKVLDHLVEHDRHYLILEYIPGQDLRQFVNQNGALPEQLALQWARELADMLIYLHGLSIPIIHRDLTPENIIVDKDNKIKLIDFGASNQFVGTVTGTVVGKQAFIPPEQLRGKTVIQSDIYAFGGTIYFLLTGKDPRPLSSNHPGEINPRLSKEIDELIAMCTSFETKDRFQTAGELAEALDKLARKAAPSGAN